jgi:hypothetical protein
VHPKLNSIEFADKNSGSIPLKDVTDKERTAALIAFFARVGVPNRNGHLAEARDCNGRDIEASRALSHTDLPKT